MTCSESVIGEDRHFPVSEEMIKRCLGRNAACLSPVVQLVTVTESPSLSLVSTVATPRKLPPVQVVPRIQAKWLFPEWQVSACSEALLGRWLASPLRQKCLLKNYDASQREALRTPKGTQTIRTS